jgi:hypothetical protein
MCSAPEFSDDRSLVDGRLAKSIADADTQAVKTSK